MFFKQFRFCLSNKFTELDIYDQILPKVSAQLNSTNPYPILFTLSGEFYFFLMRKNDFIAKEKREQEGYEQSPTSNNAKGTKKWGRTPGSEKPNLAQPNYLISIKLTQSLTRALVGMLS